MIEDCPIIKVQNISQFTSEGLVKGNIYLYRDYLEVFMLIRLF